MTNTINQNDLKRRLESGEPMILIEALPKHYYDKGHLPGAINIQHEEMLDLAPHRLPDKQATIVVYCANTQCQNSRIGAQTLINAGYKNVLEFVEGKQGWQDAGLEIIKE